MLLQTLCRDLSATVNAQFAKMNRIAEFNARWLGKFVLNFGLTQLRADAAPDSEARGPPPPCACDGSPSACATADDPPTCLIAPAVAAEPREAPERAASPTARIRFFDSADLDFQSVDLAVSEPDFSTDIAAYVRSAAQFRREWEKSILDLSDLA
jgi:hypothetical protein